MIKNFIKSQHYQAPEYIKLTRITTYITNASAILVYALFLKVEIKDSSAIIIYI